MGPQGPPPAALTLTIRTHLMRDSPKPEMAPFRLGGHEVKKKDRKKPIQLKRNATGGSRKGQIRTELVSSPTSSQTDV